MKNWDVALALITSPRSAFAELDARPRFWFPLLMVVAATCIVYGWYYSIVDLRWYLDQTLGANPNIAAMPEAQRELMYSRTNRGVLLVFSGLAAPVALVVVYLLSALYFSLAGKIGNVERSFRHWFSLTAWLALPSLIAILPAIPLLLLAETTQIPLGTLSPLSLNELFFHLTPGAKGYTLLTALTLLLPWTCWLTVVAIRTWSNKSWTFSAVFALLPQVLVFGTWSFFAFR